MTSPAGSAPDPSAARDRQVFTASAFRRMLAIFVALNGVVRLVNGSWALAAFSLLLAVSVWLMPSVSPRSPSYHFAASQAAAALAVLVMAVATLTGRDSTADLVFGILGLLLATLLAGVAVLAAVRTRPAESEPAG